MVIILCAFIVGYIGMYIQTIHTSTIYRTPKLYTYRFKNTFL
jgi:hypothetical protein